MHTGTVCALLLIFLLLLLFFFSEEGGWGRGKEGQGILHVSFVLETLMYMQ